MGKKTLMNYEDVVSLIDHYPGGMVVADLKGDIIAINKQLASILHIAREDIIGKNGYQYIEKAVGNLRAEQIHTCIKEQKIIEFIDFERGHWWKTIFVPVTLSSGKNDCFAAFIEDISSQMKDQNKKILDQKQYFLSLIQNSMDIITVINKNGEIIYETPSIERILGYNLKERIGSNIVDYIHPTDKKSAISYYKDIIYDPGIEKRFSTRIRHKNGTWRYLEWIGNNQIKNDLINGIIINSRDITENIREEQEKSLILNNTSEIIAYHDTNHVIKWVNSAYAKATGFSVDSLIGKKCYHAWGLKKPCTTCPVSLALKTGKHQKAELSPKNQKHWPKNRGSWRVIADPVKDAQGNIIGVIEFSSNITEQKKSEEKLRRSEERFKYLSELSAEGILIHKDGVLLEGNQALFKMFGYSLKDLKGKNVIELLATPPSKKIIQRHIQTGYTKPYEVYAHRKDGSILPIEVDGRKIQYKNQEARVALVRDISRLKKAEQQILEGKNFLERVIDNTSEIIFTIDHDHKITLWNKTAERLTGYKAKKVIGKKLDMFEPIDNGRELIDFLTKRFNKKPASINEISIVTQYGTKRLLSVSPSIIKDKEGNVIEVVFICNDITMQGVSHGKLIPGTSYLITDDSSDYLLNIFNGILHERKQGLFITRSVYEDVIQSYQSTQVTVAYLSTSKIDNVENIDTLEKLYSIIHDFVHKKKNSVICIDRFDYLLTTFGFDELVSTLYRINDVIRNKHSILLIRVNKAVLMNQQFDIIREEFSLLPSKQIDTVFLDSALYDILMLIYDQNQTNQLVFQTTICKDLSMSKVTAQKRISELLDKDLIVSKKEGRTKKLYITDKGKELINRRKII